MVVVTIRNKHILCIAKCKTIPWLFFKFRGSNRHIRPTGKHIADGDGVMPTPLDKFPPIPEDDGLGGSGNESHEQTTLKENTPPAAANQLRDCRIKLQALRERTQQSIPLQREKTPTNYRERAH